MPVRLISSVHWNTSGGGGITHGQQVNASNTGIAGVGLTAGDLTSQAGQTYSTSGQTIELKRFTSPVVITGDNITLRKCLFDFAGGSTTKAILISDGTTGTTVEDVTVHPPDASTSYYFAVENDGTNTTVRRCDLAGAENCFGDFGAGTLLELSYLHDARATSNPGGHVDVIETYFAAANIYRLNRIGDAIASDVTASINVAPWFGSSSVTGLDVVDNHIDNGNAHILVDLQSTGTITNVRVLRNTMGGHTNVGVFGRYAALQNSDSRAIVADDAAQALNPNAIQWPTTGANRNTWAECSDLSPNNSGQTVSP